jgi:hypothetical protein
MQQASYHAIEEVKDGTDNDKQQCHAVVTLESPVGGYAARNQIQASDDIGNVE